VEDRLYYVGVDLGQTQDYSAVCMLEQSAQYVQEIHNTVETYKAVYLHRFPLQTEYPVVVQHIKTMFDNQKLTIRGRLIVDQTGVGRAVTEMMMTEGLKPVGITITGGHEIIKTEHGEFHVPKKDLVTSLAVLLQSGRLKIIKSLPFADTLVSEMENFRVKLNLRTGNEQFEAWREGEHDDLVISLALVAWYANFTRELSTVMREAPDKNDYDPRTWEMK